MNWVKRNLEVLLVIIFSAIFMSGIGALLYFGGKESGDPKVLRTFNITLITGQKKIVSYWMNKESEVSVYSYHGSYWLEYTWHSKLGWNIRRANAGVIYFEEIRNNYQ
jgi:hypothetical protein